MTRRVDPDALCELLDAMIHMAFGDGAASEILRTMAAKVCPEPGPGIDEAIDEAIETGMEEYEGVLVYHQLDGPGQVERTAITKAITVAIRKYEEHRSKACGGSSERSSSASPAESVAQSPSSPGASPPIAPADDRRLTDEEMEAAYNAGLWEGSTDHCDSLRAVADAQLERAKVAISEAEIVAMFNRIERDYTFPADLFAWLRRHGVEVTP